VDICERRSRHPRTGTLLRKGGCYSEVINSESRLRYPLRKTAKGFKRVSWDEALKIAAEELGRFGVNLDLSVLRDAMVPGLISVQDGFLQFMGEFGLQYEQELEIFAWSPG